MYLCFLMAVFETCRYCHPLLLFCRLLPLLFWPLGDRRAVDLVHELTHASSSGCIRKDFHWAVEGVGVLEWYKHYFQLNQDLLYEKSPAAAKRVVVNWVQVSAVEQDQLLHWCSWIMAGMMATVMLLLFRFNPSARGKVSWGSYRTIELDHVTS